MSCCRNARVQRGIGLVELMVAMMLGLTLVLGTTQLLLGNKRSLLMQQQLAGMQENARFILARISRDIRQAGMFGCLDLQRLPVAVRDHLPIEFADPVVYSGGVLKLMTTVSSNDLLATPMLRSAADYDARWLLASNCLDELRIATGAEQLNVQPGDFLIPVRQVEYRQSRHSLQVRINNAGSFETLIDGVASFDVRFGLAGSAESRQMTGGYQSALGPGQGARVRSVRLALQLLHDPGSPAAEQPRLQQYTLVTALRNRLD